MKILICSSKYFYNRIKEIEEYLKSVGHKITYPNSYDNPFMEEKMKAMSRAEHIVWKQKMLRKDEENIKPQDAILVLNLEKRGIPNYLGGATFLEIYKAFELGKKIFFYNSIPNCSFTDELIAVEPVVINGNLEMIK
ncbi:MAG: hypothetical protein ABIF88_02435 [archaeon]